MSMNMVFMARLGIAGVLGAVIGMEREYRAKEAGVRTHFLVAVGSCLMMIVSQWGFHDMWSMDTSGVDVRFDVSRVAAQIVSGIGFIGAGTIMMHKRAVHGLTTAAGMWAVTGVGMAIGGGLYTLGIFATVFALIALELLRVLRRNIHPRICNFVFTIRDRSGLSRVVQGLNAMNLCILSYAAERTDTGRGEYTRVEVCIREPLSDGKTKLLEFLQQFPDIEIERIE